MTTAPDAISTILSTLRAEHPNARYELDWTTPVELLVATILAAQCTDERVNKVTATLFTKYRSARDFAFADTAELEEAIRPTGFYRNKAKAIQGACRALCDRFGGEVPRSIEQMITLPGVARKTANVVLATAFDLPTGVIVDTHVARVSQRMGLSKHDDPDRIEQDLMRLVPKDQWTFFGAAMVLHGRYTCTARSPSCGACPLAAACAKRLEPGVTPGEADRMAGEGDTKARKATASKAKAAASKSKAAASEAARPSEAGGASPTGDGGLPEIPVGWRDALAGEVSKPYFAELARFVAAERRRVSVFPPRDEVFSALRLTPYDAVNVVILGQDPYHDDNQAHGLAFSVRPPVSPPPSLMNMFKELQSDVGFRIPNHGSLVHWAEQGVLLLNAVLTVEAHTPNSHKNKGWETFTDAVLAKVAERRDPVIFVLWGAYAQKKAKLVDNGRHVVLQSAHPSPLSARNGFFGSKPFSKINEALRRAGKAEIDWQLPNV